MIRMRIVPAALGATLLLAACQPAPPSRPTRVATPAGAATATSGAAGGGLDRTGPNLVLDPNGFDVARFGDPPRVVIAALTRRLGRPGADTGWRRTLGLPGPCLGGDPRRLREVRWGGLKVYFGDGATEYGPKGTAHFNGYVLTPEPTTARARIATAAGITLGSTVAQLKAAYGARRVMLVQDNPYYGATFAVRAATRTTLFGGLTHLTDRGRVTWIQVGAICAD
jgi:hypothetical protein